MKNLVVRAASGLIYVGIIVILILLGGQYGFPALCCLFAIAAAVELYRLTDNGGGVDITMCFDILGVALIAGVPAIGNFFGSEMMLAAMLTLFITRIVLQLYTHGHSPSHRLATSFMAYLYTGMPLGIASALYTSFGPGIVLTMFIMIWLNDTGAYLVGSAIGRHRLFPRLSPKKSWEGFFGGMAFAVATAFAVKYLLPQFETGVTLSGLCVLGAIVSIAATWGDLAESMLKREAGVKDSGHIMPGHGGILDRIDSLLLVAPTVMLFLIICNQL